MHIGRWVAAASFLFVGSAEAILPDGGWYWNPSESGRGFNIEIQNNTLFMAGFLYDAQGNAIWLFTGGPMSSDHTYVGDLFQTSAGQCLGCSYQGAPQLAKYGTASINFTTSTTALITLNGIAINTQREQFGLDFSNPATPLLGEWATTEGDTTLPLYFGDRITLNSTQTTSSGLSAAGSRSGDTARVAVASYISSTNEWGILLDSSTSYYKIYSFQFTGFNRVEGIESTFLKTSSPIGYSSFVANRTKSGALVGGASAPGITKALELTNAEARDQTDAAQARSYSSEKVASQKLRALARSLELAIGR